MSTNPIRRVGCGLAVVALCATLNVVVSAQAPASPAASLPPAVLKAFQQAYPGASISGTSQERDAGRTVFRVNSADKGRRRVVIYDPSGTVIEIRDQVEERDLPKPVADAMHKHPRAIYGSGMRVTRGKMVHYELAVRGTRRKLMIAKPDGTVVSFE